MVGVAGAPPMSELGWGSGMRQRFGHRHETSREAPCSSAHSVVPFNARKIFNCSRRNFGIAKRSYETRYLCSTCDAGGTCPESLDLPGPIDATVAFVGDSLLWQLVTVAGCVLGRFDWPFYSMPVVPHRPALAELLRHVLSTADVAVFNLGIWYNWDPAQEPHDYMESSTSWHSTAQLEACIRARGDKANRTTAPLRASLGHYSPAARLAAPTNSAERENLAFWRRECASNLGKQAYTSDLLRLRNTLQEVVRERKWRCRHLIWRASTPQHYRSEGHGSGMFPVRFQSWPAIAGAPGVCSAVRNRSLAYDRNAVADRVLAPLMRRGGQPPQLTRMSTWRFDVEHHDEHARRTDCSHWCMHSSVTLGWVRQLVDCLTSGGMDCESQVVEVDGKHSIVIKGNNRGTCG